MRAQGFGARLAEARAAAGLSIRALAEQGRVDKATIVNYGAGRHMPTIDTVERLAEVLRVDPRWLAFG